ncbi:hypothetical protein [Herbiconiux ginsengi]|uniref:Uncharacterized protein n=1 Tax=Herbiconiux ginsengi TaxID=381665 RepID=A0A1H3PIZ5_9MICO|nr:hypothetical protein [Herbiconiux ginsengi]SDZ00923.1 hypothetical protein SAMN05216554_1912 [Herbiconiux ginsengi]
MSLILRWCEWYTRSLPPDVVQDRLDEIASDLHEHEADLRFACVDPLTWRRLIVSRAIRGVPADLAWREGRLRRMEAMRLGLAPTREVALTTRVVTGAVALGGIAVAIGAVACMRAIAIGAIPAGLASVTLVLAVALVLFTRPTTRVVGAAAASVALIVEGWLVVGSIGAVAAIPASALVIAAGVLVARLRR